MEPGLLDRAIHRSRLSFHDRVLRWQSKWWQIGQAALAAGAAWLVATHLLGHPRPFFAPVAAIACLGTSYGQRLRRVAEVTIGVSVGVLVADTTVSLIGSGWWQLSLIVATAMSAALLLDASQVLVSQAAVQGIMVAILLPTPGGGFTRWTDALTGGAVALVAATLVPAAPLRRPREHAARVMRKIADLLRAASHVMVDNQPEPAFALLVDARATDRLIQELQQAADEGQSVVRSSPFRRHHEPEVRMVADLVEPLDRALRSTRVLVRRTAVAAHHQRAVPRSYAVLAADLASAADQVAAELKANRMPVAARDAVLAVGQETGQVERTSDLTAEVVLGQIRSVVADLLLLTGLGQMESIDALPPPRE